MKPKTIEELNKTYDLELDKIIKTIQKNKAKKILFQFPEGMKPYAQTIVQYIEEKTDCEPIIWLGSCFGACDIPIETERLGIELLIQFGHSPWSYKDIKVL
jgi:2-(3-amino-3-carboxypropyl)histidine synthase